MKQKRIVNLFLALALALSMLVTCVSATAEDATAAEQLLVDLTGSYQELWPVILDNPNLDLVYNEPDYGRFLAMDGVQSSSE